MNEIARRWRILAGGAAAATAAVVGLTGATASAEPVLPQPPLPVPATVTQPAAVAPNAAAATPQSAGLTGVTPATGATAAGISTPPVAAPAAITPASSGTLADFFKAKGVKMEPQNSRDFKALTIVLPMPRGWSQVPDPNVPDAFAVIADRVGGNGLYSTNAQVVVYKLIGDFDPKEAISHGFVDSQQLTAWRATDGSIGDFAGMPSSVIEGTYRENSMTLNTSRRHVIASAGPDKYLVSLSVNTSVDQVVASAAATDAIVNGFRVSVPGANPTPAPVPPTPAAGAPQTPVLPQLMGLPG